MQEIKDHLSKLGFRGGRSGTHNLRTMMLAELRTLLMYVDNLDASREDYINAILNENCLSKRTESNRKITCDLIQNLYSLDLEIPVFRAMIFFWKRDEIAQPLLALLCSYARDLIFRKSAPLVLDAEIGTAITQEMFMDYYGKVEGGRYTKSMLWTTAGNVSATWSKSGHLVNRGPKLRAHVNPTPGSLSYALFLGYISGLRGQSLIESEFVKLLDCSYENAIKLAEEATSKGWVLFKRLGDVIEVQFPKLINHEELEYANE